MTILTCVLKYLLNATLSCGFHSEGLWDYVVSCWKFWWQYRMYSENMKGWHFVSDHSFNTVYTWICLENLLIFLDLLLFVHSACSKFSWDKNSTLQDLKEGHFSFTWDVTMVFQVTSTGFSSAITTSHNHCLLEQQNYCIRFIRTYTMGGCACA
jgi:hypothetical protein